jgi:hypothetical protein
MISHSFSLTQSTSWLISLTETSLDQIRLKNILKLILFSFVCSLEMKFFFKVGILDWICLLFSIQEADLLSRQKYLKKKKNNKERNVEKNLHFFNLREDMTLMFTQSFKFKGFLRCRSFDQLLCKRGTIWMIKFEWLQ